MLEKKKLPIRALPGSFEIKHTNPCPHENEMATLITFKEVIEVCKNVNSTPMILLCVDINRRIPNDE